MAQTKQAAGNKKVTKPAVTKAKAGAANTNKTSKSKSSSKKSGKLATLADFKPNMAYFVEQEGNPKGRITVQPSGRLAADATKFEHHVNRGEAYLGATVDAKHKPREFQKVKMEAQPNGTPTRPERSRMPKAQPPVQTDNIR